MFCSKYNIGMAGHKFLFVRFSLLVGCLTMVPLFNAQTSDATSTNSDDVMLGSYKVTSSVEFGYRGLDVNGDLNKYRSDFNYKKGVRIFDSSFMLEKSDNSSQPFDTLLVNISGWGADPSGYLRVNAERIGFYRLSSTVRRSKFFSNVNNFALGQHSINTEHNFGDIDLKLYPQNEKLRVNLGYSFDRRRGPGTWTVRSSGDEFGINTFTRTRTEDFRVGAEGKVFGFNFNIGQGFRFFKDRSKYTWEGFNPGNNPVGTASISSFLRELPVDGNTYFTHFGIQRTFAKKIDFTARGMYSTSSTKSSVDERVTGRDGSNNFVELDRYQISGDAKRIQSRGDLGISWRVTDKFTISDTFTYDQFGIDGGMAYEQALFRRNAGGNPLVTTFVRQQYYRVNDYRRYANMIEADYQVNDKIGFDIGYRYTSRRVNFAGYNQTLTSAPSPTNPNIFGVINENQTHVITAGMKIKPVKNWVIWWDIEHGTADNVFSRVSNYDFTNFRVRSRLTFSDFSLNLSAISKDNSNPSQTFDNPPVNFGVDAKSRVFSGSLDWAPNQYVSVSTGYTYEHQTSETAILVVVEQPDLSRPRLRGISQYFIRDNYAFLDVTARPIKWLSFYGSYRISKDKGQGNRGSNLIQNIISSYPMQLQSPEFRMAFRLTRNIDWNVGYQYFDYKERFPFAQNYQAHLPYTSLRIYFGGRAADR